jgi:uncharacterized circularly permuted ATP-grasp superfamily protein
LVSGHTFYDEMVGTDGMARAQYVAMHGHMKQMSSEVLEKRYEAMNRCMQEQGITYTVYGTVQEQAIPLDIVPRIFTAAEWAHIERGVIQRVRALNCFLADIYHEQCIVRDGIIPRSFVVSNRYFRHEMMRVRIPRDIYIACAGIDLVRDEHGTLFVLEDNVRSPSGYSYVFKARAMMQRFFHGWFSGYAVRPLEDSMRFFLAMLQSLSPSHHGAPTIALLTPGVHNAAFFEHTYLAQHMGIHLVEGSDLYSDDHRIMMRTHRGPIQVDVLYRRIDDDFLDPLTFRPDSLLGVPGIMNALRAGNIALVNAPGTGVADDKATYCYVPDMIAYYLNEKPILPNVPTYMLDQPDHLEYVLAHLEQLVVKERSLSGGYGMLIGPQATQSELAAFRDKIARAPHLFIAQPTLRLSTSPVYDGGHTVHRHVDLRAFVLTGAHTHVIPGGLTRTALRPGSLVVNSSQGGGCKDTWVLME